MIQLAGMMPEPSESTAKRRQILRRMKRDEGEMDGQMDFFAFAFSFGGGKVLLAGVDGSLSVFPSFSSRPSASTMSISSVSLCDGFGGSGSQAELSMSERISFNTPRPA